MCLGEKRVGENISISNTVEKKEKIEKKLMELACGTFWGNNMYKEV